MTNNKKRTGVLAGLLAGALLVTGTLAWQDVNQHKTNKFTTTSVEHNVTLVETFEEVTNWRKGETKVNQIAVRNGQDTDDITSYIYEDAYVRVQLKEFMEIKNKSYTYSEKRYMVDEKGNFKRFATLELAQEFMATLGEEAPEDGRIEEVTGLFDKDDEGNAKGFFYIATQQADKNGQYGKFIVMAEILGEGDVLVEGSINQDHSSEDQHNNAIVDEETGSIDYNVDEDQYATHLWGAGDNMSAEGNPFTQYVKWTFGLDVITMAEWDGQPTAQWIVDTDSTEGYAYWGEKLVHGTDATATPKSLTNNILEKVTLIEQPYGAAEYYIHVNMDAVNLKDVSLWADAPEKITKAHNGMDDYSVARKALRNSMSLAADLDAENVPTSAAQALVAEIATAQAIVDDVNSSIEALNQAKADLESAITAFKNDPISKAKSELNQKIKKGETTEIAGMSGKTKRLLREAIETANTLMENANATLEEIESAMMTIETAIAGLEVSTGPEVIEIDGLERVLDYAGHNWTVIAYNESGNALLLADAFTKEQLTSMGSNRAASGAFATSQGSAQGYVTSIANEINQLFYEKNIIESDIEEEVLTVSFEKNTTYDNNWNKDTTRVTSLNEEGTDKVFSLSIADLLVNNVDMAKTKNPGTSLAWWLRGPTNLQANTASVSATGTLESISSTTGSKSYRPAIWIASVDK